MGQRATDRLPETNDDSRKPFLVRGLESPPRIRDAAGFTMRAAVLIAIALVSATSLHADEGPALRGPGVACRSCTPDGFWIVSSRHCGQRLDERCSNGNLEYFRTTSTGPLQRSTRGAFRASLQPGAPVFLFVHGSFVDGNTALKDARLTYRWLRRNAAPGTSPQLVCFTWPSDGPTNLLLTFDVLFLGRRATHNGFYLAGLVDSLPADVPVAIIGHSHGTRVIASALHLTAGGRVNGRRMHVRQPGRRIRTVFAAAAMDNNWMNPDKRYGRAWCATERLLNIENCRDAALNLYPLRRPFSKHALGKTGFERDDLLRIGPAAGILVSADVSKRVGPAHTWPNYTRRDEIARLVLEFTNFGSTPGRAGDVSLPVPR